MKMSRSLLFLGLIALVAVNATVFEADRSEDVDLFLEQSQNETIGLLFYDSKAENTDTQGWFASLTSKILGVFMSQDQYGRSTEDWVEMFDDKLHLMRIDARSENLMRTREEFNIQEDLPFIVLQDKQRTILRERVNDDTYDHVRDLLDRRPNILHKTGGAALKSFSLEPDSDKDETEPRVIQYFDLEEGEPTNVEEPVQRQYVNWGATDVIGPDGRWMERGRNWVTSYEIPQSGIKGQENPTRLSIKDRIRDDPRPVPAAQAQPKPTAAPTQQPKPTAAPTQQPRPTVAPTQQPRPTSAPAQQPRPTSAPAQAKPAVAPTVSPTRAPVAAPSTQPRPVVASATQPRSTQVPTASTARPVNATTSQARAPATATAQPRTGTAAPAQQRAPTATSPSTGSTTQTRTAPSANPAAASSTTTQASSQDVNAQRHRYHEAGYNGYQRQYRGY